MEPFRGVFPSSRAAFEGVHDKAALVRFDGDDDWCRVAGYGGRTGRPLVIYAAPAPSPV